MPIRKQDSNVFDNFELRLNESSKKFLRKASKWAFVLSMIGFVASGILLFVGIFSLIFFKEAQTVFAGFSEFPPYVYAIFYILIAIVNFFPGLYLFSFSKRMNAALRDKSTSDLEKAFSKLGTYFIFVSLAILSSIFVFLIIILLFM
ncbi:hypothetical protein KORDIASMS9_04372 [Kordia sp. SMS9]|uniref:DUF5362 family protein n=1 Tax=Kordia sp. SMS9 TaxID=2282170 RepID=UPI000E10B5C3|nr:DUF5362 family protein [Kordia sp. SMS9]AXG72109.1 hypothetical protein KORDIASMS9_04372 [Kordia sp. SMS9]